MAMQTEMVRAKVRPEVRRELLQVAEARGYRHGGKPNLSAGLRDVLEVGLKQVKQQRRDADGES